MDIWLGVAVGIFFGLFISLIVFLFIIGNWYLGDLREDRSTGDEKPYYFMEISNGASYRMMKNRFVLLRIRRENYIPKDK